MERLVGQIALAALFPVRFFSYLGAPASAPPARLTISPAGERGSKAAA